MKYPNLPAPALLLVVAGLLPALSPAQTYTENFTGTATTNSWYFINGACLTAGTAATTSAANPACVGLPYYNSSPLPEFGGDTGTLPDTTAGGGALRFTDWFAQTGAILSNFSFSLTGAGSTGLQVSFTTVTYEGNSGGGAGDGADGMSFFLQDASVPADVGAFGGSLGYTCSNVNFDGNLRASGIPRGYDGLQGGFVGLGIDEYGNFLNQGDNTATGYNYVPMRIGLRGPGSTTWSTLSTLYPSYYPSTLTNAQGAAAVQLTCRTGYVWDFSNPATPVETGITVPDYAAIPSAFEVLPATRKLANEAATMRSQAIPIIYNLRVTPAGLLSLSYSYNGGALQNVITNQDITQGGALQIPANVRFGFAGSTGGSRNIHEIMCFQATPATTSQSSGGLNQKQTAKVQTGTQAYFAYYNPTTLAGSLTSQYVGQPVGDPNPNDLVISSVINWDGSCVLTGLAIGQVCDTTGPDRTDPGRSARESRDPVVERHDGHPLRVGQPDCGAASRARRGRCGQSHAAAVQLFAPQLLARRSQQRADSDLEHDLRPARSAPAPACSATSSIRAPPGWVRRKPRIPNSWTDKFDASGDTMSENSGQTCTSFASTSRLSRRAPTSVYAGANDGMLHGFRSGYFSSPTTYQAGDQHGHEVLAYVPGYIVNSIQNATIAIRQNYSDPQYGHHSTSMPRRAPAICSIAGQWHTWLIGGLGPGGNAIYALDITNMGDYSAGVGLAGNVPTSEAKRRVPWSGRVELSERRTDQSDLQRMTPTPRPAAITSGKTFGVPQIRRFHNGSWGAVFGNGNQTGQTVTGTQPDLRCRHLRDVGEPIERRDHLLLPRHRKTGTADEAERHLLRRGGGLGRRSHRDYVYAGDLFGNVWRFDLTSTNPSQWGVSRRQRRRRSTTAEARHAAVHHPDRSAHHDRDRGAAESPASQTRE